MQASFEVVVVSAKARGLPDGRPEVSIEENDFRDHIFGSAFLNVLYLCFSFILPHYVTKTYENKGEKKLNYNKHLQIMLFETPPFIEQQIVRRNGTRFWPALYRVPKRVPQSRNP